MKRRDFLKTAAVAASAPYFVPARALGLDGNVAPSNRITLGAIGVGGQGSYDFRTFMSDPRVQAMAVCEVDANRRKAALAMANLDESAGYEDYRDLLARKDIDAVLIATPDHTHVTIAIAAAEAGKDVYCEKPASLYVEEGRRLVEVFKRTGRIFQTGTQRRSMLGCRKACEMVINGRLGKLKPIRVGIPANFAIQGGYTGKEGPKPVPEGFNYNLWLGPAPEKPYSPGRCHFNFRWITDYSAGYITDWGAHFLDLVQWAMQADDSGPVSVEGTCEFDEGSYYDAPKNPQLTYTYANGQVVHVISTPDQSQWGVWFEGERATMRAETPTINISDRELLREPDAPGDVKLYESKRQDINFLDCVQSRKPTVAPAEVGHRTATVCHIGYIACMTGRKLQWDPVKEQFVNDDGANAMLTRPRREGW